MWAINLAAMARRNGKRRSATVRDITPPAVMASDLYADVYAPVIAVWDAAREAIMLQYSRTLAAMVTDSVADIEGELSKASAAIEQLFLMLTPSLRNWALRVERWQRGKWVAGVLAATGVDLSTMIGVESARETLAVTIARNVGLVRSISDQTRDRISAAVLDGLRNRTPAADVARDIRAATAMGRDRARRVASDQLAKLTSALADERRRDAGITEWQWLHSGKKHPRPEHVARDGNVYSDNPAMVGKSINGKRIMAPPEDRPGQLPYCGCRSRSVINLED